ncbi:MULTISPECIES: MurR/RpiR family transcriptional regulator [Heyndrickxia]|uniref:RpiR family transcriptional regulator n=1 Tax=Heyndrickxia oleronia TaxID=38875 RepID=A0A8E2I815_9BACI|nr:MurR/RpiR family transcriptional regulator [Heyndrickxia oleronia]NYV65266.1 MurR/RpiR family transcriptional regulator [Bacillus sp. Gen3]OJH20167.1 RpiR family transcriptional regulator [Bacillus obstructivus]MBU5213001.1 MurR/RpiR family transcriptional regulator [Heyndrickxia oleronia]MCI1589898.1 MurR/RpiR family transcriptional regulator [Heyndrickxia oleronia]MCI1611609.1 MurR/RpiR family transcriptional regulator [Heyndrickxia oleronia]
MFTNEMITSFNELEISLYNYIIKNSEKVIYMRIRELADQTHVSTSTILRFCRKINCDGFSEFKVKLKLYLDRKEQSNLKSTKYFLSEFVERTLKGNFEAFIQDTAELVAKSGKVIFFGTGSSGILAEYGARYFSSLGKFASFIKDPFYPINSKDLKDSTAIILSVSGETDYTLKLANLLKSEGSKIVSITNSKNCTLAKISDINIAYYVTEVYLGEANITTQIPVIYILEETAHTIKRIYETD